METEFDECGWKTKIYTRNKGKELIIKRISKFHPENNHEVYLGEKDIIFLKKLLKEECE